jgi:ectoine hydroxylase-related dioxygenase (phytanoyl-CoA dioxygenase family)
MSQYGIAETAAASDAVDLHVEEIRLNGFTVVAEAIAPNARSRWCDLIDEVVARQAADAGGVEALAALGEAHTARAPLHLQRPFLDLARHPTVLAICERLLDGYVILNQQNAVVNPPAGEHFHQTAYHRDLPYQHFVSSRPLAVSALYCADRFDEENGATLMLPGSHRQEAFPSAELVARWERGVTAPAGSYLVFDSMLFHRAGVNRSPRKRRAVNHVYSRAFLKQQIVLPRLLGDDFTHDPALRRFLGYDSDPPESVEAWLATRRARAATAVPKPSDDR